MPFLVSTHVLYCYRGTHQPDITQALFQTLEGARRYIIKEYTSMYDELREEYDYDDEDDDDDYLPSPSSLADTKFSLESLREHKYGIVHSYRDDYIDIYEIYLEEMQFMDM